MNIYKFFDLSAGSTIGYLKLPYDVILHKVYTNDKNCSESWCAIMDSDFYEHHWAGIGGKCDRLLTTSSITIFQYSIVMIYNIKSCDWDDCGEEYFNNKFSEFFSSIYIENYINSTNKINILMSDVDGSHTAMVETYENNPILSSIMKLNGFKGGLFDVIKISINTNQPDDNWMIRYDRISPRELLLDMSGTFTRDSSKYDEIVEKYINKLK